MNERLKSQKGFVAVTLITVLAIALVLVVYASLLATFQGGEVVVGSVAGNVWYSETNSTAGPWTSTLSVSSTAVPWYSMVNFTSTYTGQVQITWQLERKDGTWANVSGATKVTTIELTGASQEVYASTAGGLTGNQDWKVYATTNGQYRVTAYIETTS